MRPPTQYACLGSACEDTNAFGTASPVLIAVGAGLLIGFAQLTKRHGVENATKASELAFAAITLVVYSTGTAIPALVLFLRMDPLKRHAISSDHSWLRNLPIIVAGGLMSGMAAMLTIYSYAIRKRQMSCMIALITGGVCNVGSTVVTVVAFQERPTLMQWLSMFLMMIGTVAIDFFRYPSRDADAGSTAQSAGIEDQEKAAPLSETAFNSWGSASIKYAFLAGMSYSLANMSRVYGTSHAPAGGQASKSDLVICTGFVMEVISDLPPLAAFAWLYFARGSELKASAVLGTSRALRIIVGGVIVQCGCLAGTYALSLAGENTKALTLLMEAGVASFAGPMYIAIAYKEKPGCLQLLGALLIIAAVILAEFPSRLDLH